MTFSKTLLASAFTSLLFAPATSVADEQPGKLKTVKVEANALGNTTEQTDAYTTGSMSTATKMDLSIRETPQSVSVITRTQIQDFNLTTINDVLETATGVTVEQVETDRTYFTARGFDINNFQLDGVGTPLRWSNQNGDIDMAIYDRVEILRGASGLMSGVGNPAATINLVRKRPTADTQASLTLSHGRWDNSRADVDISGGLSERIRARVVVAEQNKDSYLRDYSKDLSIAYGVIEADLSDNTLLTAGISRQKSNADSPMWGALTLTYSDDTLTQFDRSTNTSADWAYWDVQETKGFVELAHYFDNGWNAKANYFTTKQDQDAELFYVYGTIEPDNSGLTGYASEYGVKADVEQLELSANGSFKWGDHEQKLVFGINQAKGDSVDVSLYDYTTGNGFPPIPNMAQWRGDAAYPTFADGLDGADMTDKQTGIFGAGHFRLNDQWHAVAGVRHTQFESEGYGYGRVPEFTDNDKTTPYAGIMFDFHENLTAYASYSETFLPQSETDADSRRLSPTSGKSAELGIKGDFLEGKLTTTAAIFDAEHNNIATFVRYDQQGKSVYGGEDYLSQGFEFEVAGELTESINAVLGYTNLTVDDEEGEVAKTYIPKQSLKLTTNYRPAALPALKLGANINWQSEMIIRGTPVSQDSLTLINAFASYDFSDHLSAGINLTNITDEIYFPSLYWSQAFYGEPRSVNASVTLKF